MTFFGMVSYTFANDWTIELDYRQSENDSTDPVYSYDRQRFTLGFIKAFQ